MTNLHSAQLDLPSGAHAPDPWDHRRCQLRLDHVISKDEDGKPLSSRRRLRVELDLLHREENSIVLAFLLLENEGQTDSSRRRFTAQRLALMREMQYLMVLRVYHRNAYLGSGH
jgi:hypothetical protein